MRRVLTVVSLLVLNACSSRDLPVTDAGATDGGTDTDQPVDDTSPGDDSGPSPDTGSPAPDTGAPSPDTGSAVDSGAVEDAGTADV